MRSTNTTSTLARSARIVLLCGALLAFAATPAIAQSNNQNNPVAQNQTATTTNSPASPNAQPAQPSPNSSSTPDADQSQPAQDQSQPATSTPAPDSQQQSDTKTDGDQNLPKTASDIPLVGLIAMLSFGSALLIHTGRRIVG
jgi:cytoskeletal protein RodZ